MMGIFLGTSLIWLAAVVLFTFTNTLQGDSPSKALGFAMFISTTLLIVVALVKLGIFFLSGKP